MSIALPRRALFAGAAGLILAGCSDIIGPPPAPKLYVLKPALPQDAAGAKVSWALSIRTPEAIAGLDSERIAILFPPYNLDYYAGAAWVDRLPRLVEASLLEAFEASGRIDAVAQDQDAARADYALSTDIRDFEARLDSAPGAPVAAVRIGARLLSSRTQEIVGYTNVSREERASANSVDAAVEALDTAFAAVLAQLVTWVLDRPAPG